MDYLVRKGLPFRAAHEVVGQAVALGVQNHDLSEMDLSELQAFSDLIHDDVFEVLQLSKDPWMPVTTLVERRPIRSGGSTRKSAVRSPLTLGDCRQNRLHLKLR